MAENKSGQGKVALVTGGSKGIGLALARVFARAGYEIVITGRDMNRLQAAANELSKGQGRVIALSCDVRDQGSVKKLFAEVRQHHAAIDVLINNAGIAHALVPVEELPYETWKEVIDTNLTGTFLVTQNALPLMHTGGSIVNNLSVAATTPFPQMSAYNAAKFGALGFTQALREELRKKGIRVIALMPGATRTDIWDQFWEDAPKEKMISAKSVAEAVLQAVSMPENTLVEEIRIGPAAGKL
jgi:NAD(P)-dependent dehydrogenase (short-subunit alcohol dehydrogenase family)